MSPHDHLMIEAEKFKDLLEQYVEEFEPRLGRSLYYSFKVFMDVIARFVDEDEAT